MNIEDVMVHWRYFLSLERDIEILKNYIEINDKNYETYSMEIFKILQLACSEIDSVCRVICKEIDSGTDYHDETNFNGKIDLYKRTIIERFPKIIEAEITIPGLADPLIPWQEWETKNSPEWWSGYNKAKHYRHSSYTSANLKNMLMAISGLMVMLLYLFRFISGGAKANPSPLPKFFDSKYTSPNLVCDPDKELPDFE